MTYGRFPISQRPQRQQYERSKSVANRFGADGAIGIAPVSIPRANLAPFTRLRHRLMPLCSRSAEINAINRAVSPSASNVCISPPLLNEGSALGRNAAIARRSHSAKFHALLKGSFKTVVNKLPRMGRG